MGEAYFDGGEEGDNNVGKDDEYDTDVHLDTSKGQHSPPLLDDIILRGYHSPLISFCATSFSAVHLPLAVNSEDTRTMTKTCNSCRARARMRIRLNETDEDEREMDEDTRTNGECNTKEKWMRTRRMGNATNKIQQSNRQGLAGEDKDEDEWETGVAG